MAKEIVNWLKRQPAKQEKIFAGYAANTGILYRIYKELKRKQIT